jgi:hypothetical protein
MDAIGILAAAIGGAVGGLIGGLLASLLFGKGGNRNATVVIAMVFAIVCARIASEASHGDSLRDLVKPPTRLEKVMRKHYKELEATEGFKRMAKGLDAAAARTRGQELGHAGLKRLATSDLERWNRIKLTMAESSEHLCAGFWTGRIDPIEVQGTLEKLSDADMEDWTEVMMTAMKLELDRRRSPTRS